MTKYKRADYSPLRETVYGIGFHWTTWTLPSEGEPVPFEEAVDKFDVGAFVRQAVETGAGHVLLTTTHADHRMPCPNPELDSLLPGRTSQRDLLMEIADGLAEEGIRFMLYYNHGVYNPSPSSRQDPEWQEACGATDSDRARYYDNYCRVLGWLGGHYGDKVIAWWLDSGYEHEKFSDTPWEKFTAAAKEGFPDRLVTYNSGVDNLKSYTQYQDYWAGELSGLYYRPEGDLTPEGLPWHAFCTWYPYQWGIDSTNRDNDWPPVDPVEVTELLGAFRDHGGAVTFNLLCYQDGTVPEKEMKIMKAVRRKVRQHTSLRLADSPMRS